MFYITFVSFLSSSRRMIIRENERVKKVSSSLRSSNEYFRFEIINKSQNRCWSWSRIHCANLVLLLLLTAFHFIDVQICRWNREKRGRGREREWWWWFSNNNIHNITYIYILLFVCCSFQPLKIDYYHRLKRQNHLTWHWWIFNFFFHSQVSEREKEREEKTHILRKNIYGQHDNFWLQFFLSRVCVKCVREREKKWTSLPICWMWKRQNW